MWYNSLIPRDSPGSGIPAAGPPDEGGGMAPEQGTEHNDLGALARRIERLEEQFDRIEGPAGAGAAVHPAWPLALGLTAAFFGYLGMGVPRHPYQVLFALLLLALSYHRGSLRLAPAAWKWPLAVSNLMNLALFFMILLGGGVRQPFFWCKAPAVMKQAPPEGAAWYGKVVPEYSLQWNAIAGLSDWSVDLTKVQAFLLLATLAGVLFRFPGFASLTATALLLASIPAYLSFTWDWVLLYLVLAALSCYLQAYPRRAAPDRYPW